ncbi:unnamed protein product [Clonostachys byssicola]|uniref:F-box domain-containing protein n=1 Tax=Clonostachys byssicola TaxID=160290 RepID=A0A9N9UXB7_9HYPO|nr:unnamed protein product [Clonostachys byssicola]
MEAIGNDIFQSIVDELVNVHDGNSKELAPYAAVSRQWQYALEKRIFRRCTLRTYPGELERFTEMYSMYPHRREALRELRFTSNIPRNGNTEEEHQENQDKFFSDVSALFATLRDWEQNEPDTALRPLHLRVRCCIDPAQNRRVHSEHFPPSIRPEDLDKLPCIRRITSVDVHHSRCYTVHPHTSGRLLRLMPRVERATVYFWDPQIPTTRRAAKRRAIRRAMADCILMIKDSHPGLKSLCVDRYGWQDPENHYFMPECLLENGVDTLCQAIRSLSSLPRLEELKLIDILLSPDLFEDQSTEEATDGLVEKPWPALKCLEISTECVATDGRWCFTGTPEEISDNSDFGEDDTWVATNELPPPFGRQGRYESPLHPWRFRPDPTTFNPLICGLANMSMRMPKLELGFFKIRSQSCLSRNLTFQWVSEGSPFESLTDLNNDPEYIGNWQSRQWRITVDSENATWRPDDEVKEALEAWSGKGNIIIDRPAAGPQNSRNRALRSEDNPAYSHEVL